jgi:SAM-dependent methyltransferase
VSRASACNAGSTRDAPTSPWRRVTKIPHPDERFDAAFAVHVVYFWSDPLADLSEIRRVLRPGGRVLLGYRPRDEQTVAALPATVYALRSVDDIEGLLRESGFVEVRTAERSIGKSRYAYTGARRPALAGARG